MASWPYNIGTWRALRKAKLASNPLCHACSIRGIIVQAVAVDHVKPIAKGGDPFPVLDGLMALCVRCHNEKTAAVDRTTAEPFARRFKGFDAEGNPIDPGDDWHRGGVEDGKGRGPGPFGEAGTYLVSSPKGPENGA